MFPAKDPRKALGAKGEKLAEKYLRKQKRMKLIKRNLTFKRGEIDLLMRDDDTLVIVEVRSVTHGEDLERYNRVPPAKQKQLIRLGNLVLSRMKEPLPPLRYDVCLVVLDPDDTRVIHYEDAFRPGWR